jgi:ankyrin repeat protein
MAGLAKSDALCTMIAYCGRHQVRPTGVKRNIQGPFTDRTLIQIGDGYEHPGDLARIYVGVKSRDGENDTLLHRAALRGIAQDVRDLVRLGSDVNAVGDLGHTPLHYAAMAGHRSAAEALLAAGARHALRNEWGNTPAEMADVGGHAALAVCIREDEKWRTTRSRR